MYAILAPAIYGGVAGFVAASAIGAVLYVHQQIKKH